MRTWEPQWYSAHFTGELDSGTQDKEQMITLKYPKPHYKVTEHEPYQGFTARLQNFPCSFFVDVCYWVKSKKMFSGV